MKDKTAEHKEYTLDGEPVNIFEFLTTNEWESISAREPRDLQTVSATWEVLRMKNEFTPFHFFASSIGSWKTGDDIGELIATMKLERLNFNLWKVPGDTSAEYQIRSYSPVVEGRVYLGCYEINGKKWTTVCRDSRF